MTKKHMPSTPLIYSILMIVLGVMLIIGGAGLAHNVLNILVTIGGAFILAFGILFLFQGLSVLGIGYIVVGVLVIVFAWTILWVAFLAVGLILMANAIVNMINKKSFLVVNILNLLAGLLLILLSIGVNWAWDFADILFYVIGAYLVVDGIVMMAKR